MSDSNLVTCAMCSDNVQYNEEDTIKIEIDDKDSIYLCEEHDLMLHNAISDEEFTVDGFVKWVSSYSINEFEDYDTQQLRTLIRAYKLLHEAFQ